MDGSNRYRFWSLAPITVLTALNLWACGPAMKPPEVVVVNGRAPFHRYSPIGIPVGSSQTNPCPTTLFTVPSGKILVIEYMTFFGVNNIPTPGMFVTFTTVASGVSVDYIFALAPAGMNVIGQPVFAATASTRLYADGGSAVNACAARGSTTDDGGVNISVSGYLIDQ